jgi:alpha-beta hydrolase superfamily lysophospholipase
MRIGRVIGLTVLAVILVGAAYGVARALAAGQESRDRQVALDPFYTPPDPLPGELGAVIRREPLGVDVPGGRAERILYVSERPDGTRAVSGGMIFIPEAPAPEDGRPVVAWEHGTLGMGDACVPSRSTNPMGDMTTWLGPMMDLGWVVVATDYVGLGTPGPNQYLVAQAEVRDVVNAVRAAQSIPEAQAGTRYVTFGHSQGGHASVWTGHLGPEYAPELDLLGVAAAAPALDLPQIASAQWNTTVGWVIGSDLIESWPTYYPDLPVDSILTTSGADAQARLAAECIAQSALEAQVRETFGEAFFAVNPNDQPAWRTALQEQTPPPMPDTMPVFIAQGTADQVVLAWPNAIVQEQWCAAGSMISVLWMGGVNHQDAAKVAGPAAVEWIADRFAGRPAGRTCDVPPPVPPRAPAAAATS